MDGISRSRGWDKEIPHGVLPMEQLVLSDKWARISYSSSSAAGLIDTLRVASIKHSDINSRSLEYYTLCLIKCLLLITLSNSLNPDLARQKVAPDLDPNCFTLRCYS